MDTSEKSPRERKPLTEVGIMGRMEAHFLELDDHEARQRVALYFASRAGFDIRPLLVNGEPKAD